MSEVLLIVLPVFGLMGLGWLVAAFGLVPAGADETLSDFLFNVAMPALMFHTILHADLSAASPWLVWSAYYIGALTCWALGTAVVRAGFGRDARSGVVAGVAASYSNAVMIGLPLVITAFGTEGAAPVSLLVAVHLGVSMVMTSILFERALYTDGVATASPNVSRMALQLGRAFAFNPIVVGLVLGLAWRWGELPLPAPAATIIERMSSVGATLALFTIGVGLRRYGIRGDIGPGAALAVIKLLILPAIVFAAAFWLFTLPAVWAKALVLCAACPTGVNAAVVAGRFRTAQPLASNAITLSAVAGVVSVSLWLTLLRNV